MTVSQDIKTDRYGTPDQAPEVAGPPIDTNCIVYGGTVAILRSGYVHPSDSPLSTDEVIGIIAKQTDNRTASFYGGAQGATTVPVDRGTFWLNYGAGADAFTQADCFVTQAFLIDAQTVGKSNPGGGLRPLAGIVKAFDSTLSKVAVALGTSAGTIF